MAAFISIEQGTFTANRSNLRLQLLVERFFQVQLQFLRESGLISDEHLSVDGTLLQAWASQKSLVERSKLDDDGKPPKPTKGGRNAWHDFKGENRSSATHVSASDPDAKLASKGGTPKLAHEMSILAENRNNFAIGIGIRAPERRANRNATRQKR
ncbi:MAG: hypothetical protein AB2A00_09615 [Myxococcota bacterium]